MTHSSSTSDRSGRRPRLVLGLLALAVLVAATIGGYFLFRKGGQPRQLEPQKYQEFVSAFSMGVAALQVDVAEVARVKLTLATEIAPEEPATWANRGLLYLRLRDLDAAARDLERAQALAPESSDIEMLRGFLESTRGQSATASEHLRSAAHARFGLGEHTTAEVVRIAWPNGSAQAEFELKADQAVVAEQRLKGSCPSTRASATCASCWPGSMTAT